MPGGRSDGHAVTANPPCPRRAGNGEPSLPPGGRPARGSRCGTWLTSATTTRCWALNVAPRPRRSPTPTASWRSASTPTRTRVTPTLRRGSRRRPGRSRCCRMPTCARATIATAMLGCRAVGSTTSTTWGTSSRLSATCSAAASSETRSRAAASVGPGPARGGTCSARSRCLCSRPPVASPGRWSSIATRPAGRATAAARRRVRSPRPASIAAARGR